VYEVGPTNVEITGRHKIYKKMMKNLTGKEYKNCTEDS